MVYTKKETNSSSIMDTVVSILNNTQPSHPPVKTKQPKRTTQRRTRSRSARRTKDKNTIANESKKTQNVQTASQTNSSCANACSGGAQHRPLTINDIFIAVLMAFACCVFMLWIANFNILNFLMLSCLLVSIHLYLQNQDMIHAQIIQSLRFVMNCGLTIHYKVMHLMYRLYICYNYICAVCGILCIGYIGYFYYCM